MIKAELQNVHPSCKIDETVFIEANRLVIEEGVTIGSNVKIIGHDVYIKSKASIAANNFFDFKKINIGYKSKIEEGGKYRSLKGQGDLFEVSDFSFLGHNQNCLCSTFTIGDYTTIHNSCFITGFEPCLIGHNCWIGQGTILNSNKKLTIGNNVGIGTNSQLWTHIIHGELLEGCTLHGEHPLTIEDDVWIVGGAVISPNLTLRKGSVIMVGSVLTRSTEKFHCYAGVPAKDITDKINPYKEISLDEKYAMMSTFLDDYNSTNGARYKDDIYLLTDIKSFNGNTNTRPAVVIIKNGKPESLGDQISVFSLETKTYIKRLTDIEESFVRFHERFRAKFIPVLQ
jgi:acetyltransferase-like isoleucine patch superfamily enzyme